ncbi:Uncharacterised protein [Raoultella planticola]|uniref:Uncharacterized protein n=1 Tax=Raoultella planticola TaxID=575 RepID=A0A485A746_RAOPL|nr:Uncharacterised protein [Raoultella planticola]
MHFTPFGQMEIGRADRLYLFHRLKHLAGNSRILEGYRRAQTADTGTQSLMLSCCSPYIASSGK